MDLLLLPQTMGLLVNPIAQIGAASVDSWQDGVGDYACTAGRRITVEALGPALRWDTELPLEHITRYELRSVAGDHPS